MKETLCQREREREREREVESESERETEREKKPAEQSVQYIYITWANGMVLFCSRINKLAFALET